MGAKDFILNKLEKLGNKLNDVEIRYSYDKISEFHIVEISPETIRRGNNDYMEWEENTWDEFDSMFPTEDLLISGPTDIKNSEIIYEKVAIKWQRQSTVFDIADFGSFATMDYTNVGEFKERIDNFCEAYPIHETCYCFEAA